MRVLIWDRLGFTLNCRIFSFYLEVKALIVVAPFSYFSN